MGFVLVVVVVAVDVSSVRVLKEVRGLIRLLPSSEEGEADPIADPASLRLETPPLLPSKGEGDDPGRDPKLLRLEIPLLLLPPLSEDNDDDESSRGDAAVVEGIIPLSDCTAVPSARSLRPPTASPTIPLFSLRLFLLRALSSVLPPLFADGSSFPQSVMTSLLCNLLNLKGISPYLADFDENDEIFELVCGEEMYKKHEKDPIMNIIMSIVLNERSELLLTE